MPLTEEEKKAEEERKKVMTETLTTLSTAVGAMTEGMKGLGERIGNIEEGIKPVEKETEKTYDNLEALSRKDFLDVIVDKVGGVIKDGIDPIDEKVKTMSDDRRNSATFQQIEKAKGKYKDFEDWKPELVAKIQSTKGAVSIDEAYVLVRAENSDKRKELDEKYKGDEDVKKDEGPKFGGLTPTSGKTIPSEELEGTDAAELAWDKVMGAGVTDVHTAG